MDKPIPRILWSNQANFRYTGEARDGFVNGAGYMDEALRIAATPSGFHKVDLEKAARILRATKQRFLIAQAVHCTQMLEERQQTAMRKLIG